MGTVGIINGSTHTVGSRHSNTYHIGLGTTEGIGATENDIEFTSFTTNAVLHHTVNQNIIELLGQSSLGQGVSASAITCEEVFVNYHIECIILCSLFQGCNVATLEQSQGRVVCCVYIIQGNLAQYLVDDLHKETITISFM